MSVCSVPGITGTNPTPQLRPAGRGRRAICRAGSR